MTSNTRTPPITAHYTFSAVDFENEKLLRRNRSRESSPQLKRATSKSDLAESDQEESSFSYLEDGDLEYVSDDDDYTTRDRKRSRSRGLKNIKQEVKSLSNPVNQKAKNATTNGTTKRKHNAKSDAKSEVSDSSGSGMANSDSSEECITQLLRRQSRLETYWSSIVSSSSSSSSNNNSSNNNSSSSSAVNNSSTRLSSSSSPELRTALLAYRAKALGVVALASSRSPERLVKDLHTVLVPSRLSTEAEDEADSSDYKRLLCYRTVR